MTDSEFNTMIERADRKYKFSDIEKMKIRELLEYCHAVDVRWTLRRMYEVYFKCDAMPGMELTTGTCSDECARYGCSNCTAADDAELLINQSFINITGRKTGECPKQSCNRLYRKFRRN